MNFTTPWPRLIRRESAINTSKTGLKEQWLAFRTALQFLSWIPAGQLPFPDPKILGKSVAWYPLIGLLLGLILGVLAIASTHLFNSWISAGLILTAWVWLTGALHLDGLADSADAWLGGLGSKARTLKLMKDPTSGPIAIATLILILFLKLACLQALLEANLHWVLLWALVFARCNAVLLLIHTPYVREQGLGNALSQQLSKNTCYGVLAALALISFFSLSWASVIVIIGAGLTLFSLRHYMLKRLNGCTGDTLGALIELSETTILLSLAACLISA